MDSISDNGSNLCKDIMSTFSIQVRFTPAYHPATSGAVERTIKNSLKAVLVDMGEKLKNNWMRALPWVMLGKRVAVQPDLDASAAMLTFEADYTSRIYLPRNRFWAISG